MLLVRILLSMLHSQNSCTGLPSSVIAWGQARSKLGGVDTSKKHHYLYIDFTLFIDIFHFKDCSYVVLACLHSLQLSGAEAAELEFSGKKWIPSCRIRSSPNAMKIYGDQF